MADSSAVRWSKKVDKQLSRLPDAIALKFYAWVSLVQLSGIRAVRTRPGFHDEPLKGDRKGQRSIRLNRSYRAIYIELSQELVIEVIEVNKHEY